MAPLIVHCYSTTCSMAKIPLVFKYQSIPARFITDMSLLLMPKPYTPQSQSVNPTQTSASHHLNQEYQAERSCGAADIQRGSKIVRCDHEVEQKLLVLLVYGFDW